MTDPEHFLSRWARKKSEEQSAEQREEKRQAVEPPGPAANAAPDAALPQSEGTDKPGDGRAPDAEHKPAASAPAFDPLNLPSIDSIGAQTDISAFLKPGVPSELRLAALRRAWSMDPAIRDFKGLQENDWNFNDPNGIPGFGVLDPGVDVKKMVARLFGESPKDDSQTAVEKTAEPDQQPAPTTSKLAAAGEGGVFDAAASSDENLRDNSHQPDPGGTFPANTSEQNDFVQRDKNTAAQNNKSQSEPVAIKRHRPRGGALPQ